MSIAVNRSKPMYVQDQRERNLRSTNPRSKNPSVLIVVGNGFLGKVRVLQRGVLNLDVRGGPLSCAVGSSIVRRCV